MTPIVSVVIGLIIVLAAVGIPYYLTHRRMHPHHDLSEGQAYLEATGKTPEDAIAGRTGRSSRRNPAAARQPMPWTDPAD